MSGLWCSSFIKIGHPEGRAGLEVEGRSARSVLSKFGKGDCEVPVKCTGRTVE